MLELLIAFGLSLLQKIGIGDIIGLSGLANGLIRKISGKDAFGILKKALDETIKQSEDDKAKSILKNLKKNDEVLRELLKLDVSEEARRFLVSQYFDGREDVFEDLAKNYYVLFCKEATKKDGTFKEFVVIELGKLTGQGIVTDEVVKSVERHLEGIIEEIKREKEAESRQFLITSDLKELGSEILRGKPQIEYVEREEIREAQESLKTKNELLVVGKPGAGKSRFMLRILEDFNGYEGFVLIRSFFREDGISSLDAELQELDSYILIWDDIHRAKNELVNQTIAQVEQLARDYGKEYMFISASRMEGEYYQFKPEEIKLKDFRSLELIEKCSAYFGVSIKGEAVKKRLLEVGDGTPFYVISLFATSKERDKERLMVEDMKTLPKDAFEIWHDHLDFLESEGRLTCSEAVPAIDFEVLEKFYDKIFRGNLSEFDYALKSIGKKFFIGIEGEFCSMHAVPVAAVEEKYPVEERKIEILKKVLVSLDKERSLILLWGFADWLYKSKKYEDCLKFWDEFIKKEPNIDAAYNNRGLAYADLDLHERAIEDYDKAIELNPNLAETYNNRGAAYDGLNQHERAIEDYGKAIELNPDLAGAYNNRGLAYAGLNQYERAIEDYGRAIELNSTFAEAYSNRGLAYAELNQYERAIEDYGRAIGLNSTFAEAYSNRGIAYAELNQHERAIRDYGKAIELNPNLAEAYHNRGTTYAGLNEHERAIEDYGKVIELNPDYAEAYYNRGTTYAGLNEHERAIEDYDRAIELNSTFAEAYSNRGIAYAELNQHERAIEDFVKAIELNPDYAGAYYNRGLAYAGLNEHERAIEDYGKATELNPNDAKAYYNRGNAYYKLNQYERAIEDYNKAIELNPNDAKAYNNRGLAYAGLNQYGRAIEDYGRAIELNPNDAEAYGNRGITYKESGNYEQSAKDLKRAGILFLKSGSTGDAAKVFFICFALREEVKSDDTVYCGLALFLITLNPDGIIALRKMKTKDETLRELLELAMRKLRKEDVSAEIATIESEEKREEMQILLELLKRF
jgi:tetratricopeptide (TPR) repeat protein